jgi:hypothetical protein
MKNKQNHPQRHSGKVKVITLLSLSTLCLITLFSAIPNGLLLMMQATGVGILCSGLSLAVLYALGQSRRLGEQ